MNTSVTFSPDESGAGWLVAARFSLLSIVLAGLAFPAAAALLGGALFPYQAQGSLIEVEGRVVGSALVAQPFVADTYFHPRPSAANYDPRALAGSNWAPSNPALEERIAASSSAIAAAEGVAASSIPSDLVTASGSGIDPHISVEAAALQVARVAQARGVDAARVQALVDAHTLGKTWGVLGQARVNVLQLNIALDAL
jgi:potassium-transporting ATPase KdpC subunit